MKHRSREATAPNAVTGRNVALGQTECVGDNARVCTVDQTRLYSAPYSVSIKSCLPVAQCNVLLTRNCILCIVLACSTVSRPWVPRLGTHHCPEAAKAKPGLSKASSPLSLSLSLSLLSFCLFHFLLSFDLSTFYRSTSVCT